MRARNWAALCLAVLALGCSGASKGTITGKVTIAGKPMKGGTISFMLGQPDAVPLTFPVDDDGNYEAIGLAFGAHLIAVAPRDNGAISMDQHQSKLRMAEYVDRGEPVPYELQRASGGLSTQGKPLVDGKYMDPLQSGLSITLETPTLQHNVEIP